MYGGLVWTRPGTDFPSGALRVTSRLRDIIETERFLSPSPSSIFYPRLSPPEHRKKRNDWFVSLNSQITYTCTRSSSDRRGNVDSASFHARLRRLRSAGGFSCGGESPRDFSRSSAMEYTGRSVAVDLIIAVDGPVTVRCASEQYC